MFHVLASSASLGVDIIIGCNGLIWIAPSSGDEAAASGVDDESGDAEPSGAQQCRALTLQSVEATTR